MSDVWKDPDVMAALKEGRTPDDIWVLSCPQCGKLGYYNEGSHFSCKRCGVFAYVLGEDEPQPDRSWCVAAADAVTLADTVTEVTEGYENETKKP